MGQTCTMAPTVLILVLAGLILEASLVGSTDLEWGEWSSCSRSCEGGRQVRHRVCDQGVDRLVCRMLKSRYNWADLVERRPCNEISCDVRGVWATWGAWQPCSSTCGSHSFRVRTRQCIKLDEISLVDTVNVGESCEATTMDDWIAPCEDLPPCPEQDEHEGVAEVQDYIAESYSSLFSVGESEAEPTPSDSSSWSHA